MEEPVVAIVMAGGTGTRLYPASRSDRPKQFLRFDKDQSLLERTVERVSFADEIVISTRAEFADRISELVPSADVLVEPAPKDTGPALVYAARQVQETYGDCCMVCLPSDHHIAGDFKSTIQQAVDTAVETNGLVTIGIEPDRPATGYGYIQPTDTADQYSAVDRFLEKPGAATAKSLVERGCYWNAGIFAWTPSALLAAAGTSVLSPLVESDDPEAAFQQVEAISIDYAILEQADNVYVVPGSFDWDDLGTWDAVGRYIEGSTCDTVEIDTDGTVIAGDEDVHITAIGISDLVIVAYDDHILVVPKSEAQRVREAVEVLQGRDQF